MQTDYDVIIIGAGAAGLFCSALIGQNHQRVLVLDHANKVGKKILMSGGGRCNFTNLNTQADDFFSANPHFCKSALSQYTAYDFLARVEKHHIEYTEKAAGQLFCQHSSKQILQMLLDECAAGAVKIYKKCQINKITTVENTGYRISTSMAEFTSRKLVVATGGLSIPTLGASGFGYDIARQFGHQIIKTRPALVPITLNKEDLKELSQLVGVSARATLSDSEQHYQVTDDILFTHRGISGPAILKLSALRQTIDKIVINLLPGIEIESFIQEQLEKNAEKQLGNVLSQMIARKLLQFRCTEKLSKLKLKQLNKQHIEQLRYALQQWSLTPSGNEGYRSAEVTAGGVSTEEISSKTMQSSRQPGLYFIGEVLDVTGQLGGFNFQWAWSSAWCAAKAITNYKLTDQA